MVQGTCEASRRPRAVKPAVRRPEGYSRAGYACPGNLQIDAGRPERHAAPPIVTGVADMPGSVSFAASLGLAVLLAVTGSARAQAPGDEPLEVAAVRACA